MSTITAEQQQAIAAYLEGMTLPSGLGSEESACSIAAINLALAGELTDNIPACMSEVIGNWIIPIQDAMPDEIRNSQQWKALLPLAAGTGLEMEQERLAVIMDWMWGKVLPTLQPVADESGFGAQWLAMTTDRTEAAAKVARAAAAAALGTAALAAHAAWAAAYAAAWEASDDATEAAMAAARLAADAAWAADAWTTSDPCGLLERLIRAGEQNPST